MWKATFPTNKMQVSVLPAHERGLDFGSPRTHTPFQNTPNWSLVQSNRLLGKQVQRKTTQAGSTHQPKFSR